jgi:hypothetical protein
MVAKPYLWQSGATLQEHSRRKHKILREYFSRYLSVRCQLPQQARFRLAIVEGFSGGGRYACGAAGSPIIFIEELRAAAERFNLTRTAERMAPLDIECLLVFNDESPAQLSFLGATPADLSCLDGRMSNNEWLGAAERLVFASFRSCAKYVSPFSINNPEGWRYWLIHFAGNYRARQEYNNVLHQNSSMQAHFGRSGLHMLSFDPADGANALYLFDMSGRAESKKQLFDDIPRLVTEFGDAIGVGEFYGSIYNMTPAHMDDVHAAIIENPDLQVLTGSGGERRKANTIEAGDTLRVKQQRSFFPIFLGGDKGLK